VRKINCTPKPSMLRAIQNQSWNVAGALAELVDNSLGSKRGDAGNVTITYEPRHRIIEVLDDGRGANDMATCVGSARQSVAVSATSASLAAAASTRTFG